MYPIGLLRPIRSRKLPTGMRIVGHDGGDLAASPGLPADVASGTACRRRVAGSPTASTRIAKWNEAKLPAGQISQPGGGSLVPNVRKSKTSGRVGWAGGAGVAVGGGGGGTTAGRRRPEPPHGLTIAIDDGRHDDGDDPADVPVDARAADR